MERKEAAKKSSKAKTEEGRAKSKAKFQLLADFRDRTVTMDALPKDVYVSRPVYQEWSELEKFRTNFNRVKADMRIKKAVGEDLGLNTSKCNLFCLFFKRI